MTVSVEALKRAYSILEQNVKTEDDCCLVNILQFIITKCMSNDSDSADLEDVSSYKAAVLWNGPNDIDDMINNGHFCTKIIDSLSSNVYWTFIKDISDTVDWKQLQEDATALGNQMIADAIYEYGKAHPKLELGG